jgi:hypothetical protein
MNLTRLAQALPGVVSVRGSLAKHGAATGCSDSVAFSQNFSKVQTAKDLGRATQPKMWTP